MAKLLFHCLFLIVIAKVLAEELVEEHAEENTDNLVEDRREFIDGCLRPGAKATGKHLRTGTLRVNSALQCQKLCAAEDECNYFRWRGRDLKAKWRLRRRCYLLAEKTDVKKREQWTWGPKECPESAEVP